MNLTITCPAKVNLTLRVVGKRADGYHTLSSLVAFTDFGDAITILPHQQDRFETSGMFAKALGAREDNLALKAARAMCKATNRPHDFGIHLQKNIPIAAGLGGGSADAAGIVRALLSYWGLRLDEIKDFDGLLQSLGADVPVCFYGRPAMMENIGDLITPLSTFPECAILLINPFKACLTEDIFKTMSVPDKSPPPHPNIARLEDLLSYMQAHGNDMQPVAQKMIPEISGIIALLKKTKHCLYAGMSGSGATCFGIFKNERECEQARVEIVRGNQDIWCVSTKLTTQ